LQLSRLFMVVATTVNVQVEENVCFEREFHGRKAFVVCSLLAALESFLRLMLTSATNAQK
jgi:hypothetical protein